MIAETHFTFSLLSKAQNPFMGPVAVTSAANKNTSNLETNLHMTHFFSSSQDLKPELMSRENKIPVTFPEDISGLDFKHNPPSGQIRWLPNFFLPRLVKSGDYRIFFQD